MTKIEQISQEKMHLILAKKSRSTQEKKDAYYFEGFTLYLYI